MHGYLTFSIEKETSNILSCYGILKTGISSLFVMTVCFLRVAKTFLDAIASQ